VEIDTAHFMGNFPESCVVEALDEDGVDWTTVLPQTKLGPHRQHYFQLENVGSKVFTHVRIIIHPDGGIKRIRVLGRRSSARLAPTLGPSTLDKSPGVSPPDGYMPVDIPVLPITPEAFATFGRVIQGYDNINAVPRGTRVTSANGGSATKFHKLSLLESAYPAGSQASSGLSVYTIQPRNKAGRLTLTTLERHRFTNQTFVPMGSSGSKYLVVVAQNGPDDRPDLKTLRAFSATSSQGITYNMGIWRTSFLDFIQLTMR
jgi:allantoicase